MCRYTCCAITVKQTKSDADRSQTVLEVLSTYLKPSHSNQHRARIPKGVTCITYRANIYAMMIGSLTDEQTGHNKEKYNGGAR